MDSEDMSIMVLKISLIVAAAFMVILSVMPIMNKPTEMERMLMEIEYKRELIKLKSDAELELLIMEVDSLIKVSDKYK